MDIEKLEEEIENKILNEVFIGCFSNKHFKEGKKILRDLYFRYYSIIKNFETKRKILYNLIYAERTTTNIESSIQLWVTQLKNDMDLIPNYKYNFTGEYCKMLSYYCDCNLNLSRDEKLEHYGFCLQYHKKAYELKQDLDNFINLKNIEFNIFRIKNDLTQVLEIIKDLHNIKHTKAEATIKQIINDLREIDVKIYEEVKNKLKYKTKISI